MGLCDFCIALLYPFEKSAIRLFHAISHEWKCGLTGQASLFAHFGCHEQQKGQVRARLSHRCGDDEIDHVKVELAAIVYAPMSLK
jgi:hypothetical protein